MWGLIVEDRQHRTRRASVDGVDPVSLRPIAAPATGLALIVAVWMWGGRAGWASGMIVTPAEAISPDRRRQPRRRTSGPRAATVWAAAAGSSSVGRWPSSPRSWRPACRCCAGSSSAWPRSPTPRPGSPWPRACSSSSGATVARSRSPRSPCSSSCSCRRRSASAPRRPPPTTWPAALGASRFRRMWSVQLPGVVAVGRRRAQAGRAGRAGRRHLRRVVRRRARARRAADHRHAGRPGRAAVGGLAAQRRVRADSPSRCWRGCRTLAGPPVRLDDRRSSPPTVPRAHSSRLPRIARRDRPRSPPWSSCWSPPGGRGSRWRTSRRSSCRARRPCWDDLVAAPGEYLSATVRTLRTAAIALASAPWSGSAAALAASRLRVPGRDDGPVVVVLAATPLVALFPLFARVFGYQPTTVLAPRRGDGLLPGLRVHPLGPAGRQPSRRSTSSTRSAAVPSARFRSVVLPAAVPHIASGFRIAAGSAVIAAVVGESLIGRKGLGVEFSYAYQPARPAPGLRRRARRRRRVGRWCSRWPASSSEPSTAGGHEPTPPTTDRQEVQMNQRYDRRLFLVQIHRRDRRTHDRRPASPMLGGCGDDDDDPRCPARRHGRHARRHHRCDDGRDHAGTSGRRPRPLGTVGTQFNWVPDVEWAAWYLGRRQRALRRARRRRPSSVHGGPNTPAVVQVLAAGDGNVGLSASELDIIQANSEGSDFVIIGAMYQRNPLGLTWLAGDRRSTPPRTSSASASAARRATRCRSTPCSRSTACPSTTSTSR